jgi:hypothetical protein
MDNIFEEIEKNIEETTDIFVESSNTANLYVNQLINNAIRNESLSESKSEIQVEVETEYNKSNILENDPFELKLTPTELKLQSNFIGCYIDNPSKPTFTDYLGEVDNQEQCINKGKEKNFNFVGIQQGNKCFGSNFVPEDIKRADRLKCSTDCNDKSKGKCGGFYYSNIFSTKNTELSKPSDIVEKFKSLNIELVDISNNLKEEQFVTENPINPYSLLLWLVVILIIIYIIIEYINKKSNEKL